MRYDLFGMVLKTELEFFMLNISQNADDKNLIILSVVPFEKYIENDLYNKERYFVVNFGINLVYIVPKPENECNEIIVFSDDDEKIRSSFLNIPISLFLLRYKGFLLHISCIEQSGLIIGFCGEKGVGKSTITYLLAKHYNLFSDDALYIQSDKSNLIGYRTNSFLRVDKNTFKLYGNDEDFDNHKKNLAGKAYVFPERMNLKSSQIDTAYLKRIYFLKRYKENQMKNILIDSLIKKKMLLFNNIIGTKYIDDSLFLSIGYWEAYHSLIDNTEFYEMSIPNDLSDVKKVVEHQMINLFDVFYK